MKFVLKIYILILIAALTACIEDDVTTSPSARPVFSVDTLRIGDVFTGELTPTHRFTVRNPHSGTLVLSNISAPGADWLRLNVDGMSGTSFTDVEIRAKDSIFVFVEAMLPESEGLRQDYKARIEFTANGTTSGVVVSASGINAERLRAVTLSEDTRFAAGRPYIIYDSLVVASGTRLTLDAGAHLCFHDKASLIVRGSLVSEGTPRNPVELTGDRTGNVVGDISFDIMSRQWNGVYFASTSAGNTLSHTVIKNTSAGVAAEGTDLTLVNCRLRNSGSTVLRAAHSTVEAAGCEFAEAADGPVILHGGKHRFDQCTFANNYLFAAVSGPAISFRHLSADPKTGYDDGSGKPYVSALFTNSIVYGLGAGLSHADLTGTDISFGRCLFKEDGKDDANFTECIWAVDPHFRTIRDQYLFDYRLREDSPAIGAAAADRGLPASATDFFGLSRGDQPDLGAYVYRPDNK